LGFKTSKNIKSIQKSITWLKIKILAKNQKFKGSKFSSNLEIPAKEQNDLEIILKKWLQKNYFEKHAKKSYF